MPSAGRLHPAPDRSGQDSTRLGFDGGARALIAGVCAGLGLLLGLVIRPVAGWASGLDWAPFQGPLRLIASADQPWVGWLVAGLGLVAGSVFAVVIFHESPVLHVARDQIRVHQKGAERIIKRSDVATVHRDGKHLVLETESGRTLFRGEVEGGRDAVREAFISRGYPWDAEPG